MILGICDTPKVLEVMNIVNIIITIIRIVVPIVLLFSLTFKLVNASTKNDEDALASIKKKAVPSIIAAALIFIVPVLVNLIVSVSFPNSEYTKCIANISSEKIETIYTDKEDKLVGKAEETLNINDYINAKNYLTNIKDNSKRESYEARLEEVKKIIDEGRQPQNTDKVNYSNFKWTYYSPNSGPVSEYYTRTISYAIWAPDSISDLNGTVLPIMIWLHGAGETYDKVSNGDKYLNRSLMKMVSEWDKYGLKQIPAIIIAPQAPQVADHWSTYRIYESIRAMIRYVSEEYNCPTDNIALVGHSMGGGGVLLINDNMRGTFRTLVPMSPGYGYIGHADEYLTLRVKGFDEDCTVAKVFKWMHHENDFTCLQGMKHEDVPEYVLTKDDNGDGVSDIIEWMYLE